MTEPTGDPDGGIWLDGLDGVAADLAGVALDALADAHRRPRTQAERDADGQAWWWRGNDGQWQPGPPPHVAEWLRQSAANPRPTRPDDLDRLRARAQGLTPAVTDLVVRTVPGDQLVRPWALRAAATGGGPCPTCGKPFYTHVCLSCSPDSQTPGPGCHNCRRTGMDQTPCMPTTSGVPERTHAESGIAARQLNGDIGPDDRLGGHRPNPDDRRT